MSFMMILGALLLAAGSIAFIWLAVVAFRQGVGWGLAVLFLPLANVIFAIKHWHEAKRPFLANLALSFLGVGCMVGAGVMAASNAQAMLEQQMMNDPEFAKAMQDLQKLGEDMEAQARANQQAPSQEAVGEESPLPASTPPPPSATAALRVIEDDIQADDEDTDDWLQASAVGKQIQTAMAGKYVGSKMRIVSQHDTEMTATLTAVRGNRLVFERELAGGTAQIELNRSDVKTLELM